MTSPGLPSSSGPGSGLPVADKPVEEERPPVVFWIVVGATFLYMALRLLQGVAWLVRQVA